MADQINALGSDPFARSWNTPLRARRLAPLRNDKSLLAVLDRIAATEGCTRRGNRPFPHPFPARMPIDVAFTAIEGLTEPGDIVLDPMSGSGVVPHAAQRLNRVGIGRDIDPLAILLGRALCLPTAPRKLFAAGEHVLDRARSIARGPEFLENCLKRRTEEEQKFIGYWFKERAAAEMFALTVALEELAPGPVMLALYVALSSLVISRGSGASMAMDLSRSRPHRVLTKIPRLPFDGWMKRVGEFVRHYENRGSMADEADVRLGDARDLTLPDESVDAVITSPPYVNAIDYFRTSKFSLVFFGFDLATLREIRSTSIGTEVGLQRAQLSTALETLVEQRVMDRQRRPMLRQYVNDLLETLRETYRVLRPGGRALYVMGPSILSRREYDGAKVLGQIAAFVGYRVVGCSRRDLSPANRSLPPPRRVARAQVINRRMTCELYALLLKEDG